MSRFARGGSRSRSTRTSMPAVNARPAPVSTATRTEGSRASASNVARRVRIRRGSRRLSGGRASAHQTTEPSRSTSSPAVMPRIEHTRFAPRAAVPSRPTPRGGSGRAPGPDRRRSREEHTRRRNDFSVSVSAARAHSGRLLFWRPCPTRPLSDRPACAHVINAVSGVMHLEQEGERAPRVAYLQTADVLAGTHAFGAIGAALLRRARTGQGAHLDVSMLESLIAAEDISYGSVLNGGPEYPGPRAGMVVHAIGDRHLAMQTVGAPQLWPRLVAALARPELAQGPRFATPLARRENWPALRAIIGQWLDRFKTVEAALDALHAARIPGAPVLTPPEVAAHPPLSARDALPAVPHPTRGAVRVTATPFHLDGRPVGPTGAAPYRVGEHTRAVLRAVLGYPAGRIDELLRAGAIAAPC